MPTLPLSSCWTLGGPLGPALERSAFQESCVSTARGARDGGSILSLQNLIQEVDLANPAAEDREPSCQRLIKARPGGAYGLCQALEAAWPEQGRPRGRGGSEMSLEALGWWEMGADRGSA